MNKFSNFVVCYRKYHELTFYIGFRPLEPFFSSKKSLFSPFFLAILAFFGILKLRFLKILKNKFSHFVVCYRRHLELTFYIGYRPLESFVCLKTLFCYFLAISSVFPYYNSDFLKSPRTVFLIL